MIDYEKLKTCHELARKIWAIERTEIVIKHEYFAQMDAGHYVVTIGTNKPKIYDSNGLLQFLQQIAQPKPKYEVHQDVWIILKNKPTIATVWAIEDGIYHLGLENGHTHIHEEFIYPTKSALIQSQIDYWKRMKEQE